VNLLMTMVIGGFWHGANWTFILWGFWHGGLLALHRFWRNALGMAAMPWLLGHALLIFIVILGWVAFRAPSFESAFTMYFAMFGRNWGGVSDALAWQVTPDQWWFIGFGILLVYLPLLGDRLPLLRQPEAITGLWRPIWAYWPVAAFLLGMVLLYSRAAVPFLYFQF
jgi:alginate O-acetyltransferase complex protein AlgI